MIRDSNVKVDKKTEVSIHGSYQRTGSGSFGPDAEVSPGPVSASGTDDFRPDTDATSGLKRENAPDETSEDMLDFGEDRDDYPDLESYPSAAEMAEQRTGRVLEPKPKSKPEPEPKPEPPVDGE